MSQMGTKSFGDGLNIILVVNETSKSSLVNYVHA